MILNPMFLNLKESGDGNRIAALVIETLACVLEGSFDEGIGHPTVITIPMTG